MLRVPWVGLPVTWAREGDVARLVLLAASIAVLLALATLDGPLRRRVEQESPGTSGASDALDTSGMPGTLAMPGGPGAPGTPGGPGSAGVADPGHAPVATLSGVAPAASGPGIAPASSSLGIAPAASGLPSRRAVRHRSRAARRRKGAAGGIAVVVAVVGMTSLLPAEAVAAPFRATTSATTGTLVAGSVTPATNLRCSAAGLSAVSISWTQAGSTAQKFEVVTATGVVLATVTAVAGQTSYSTTVRGGLLALGQSMVTVRTVPTVDYSPWTATAETSVPVNAVTGLLIGC